MDYIKCVSDYFGESWLDSNWESFRQSRINSIAEILTAAEIKADLDLHPLIYDIANYQDISSSHVDLRRIPQDSTYRLLCHLGRDIDLLHNELGERGNKLKHSLCQQKEFNSHRFTLLVAAGFKLLNYKIEFLPEVKGKNTADLKVTYGSREYFVECKQRNQDVADRERYLCTGEYQEHLFNLFRQLGITNLLIDIEATGNIDTYKNTLLKLLVLYIRVNIYEKKPLEWDVDGNKVIIKFFYTDSKPELLNILEQERNIKMITHVTRTEDAFCAVDLKNKNIILLNKNSKEDDPQIDNLYNANLKEKGNSKLIVYYDMGRSYESWTDKIGSMIYKDLNENNYAFENIDLLVTCQTMPKYRNNEVIIKPDFRGVGKISKIGGNPADLRLFGFQGDTGMDHYFIN